MHTTTVREPAKPSPRDDDVADIRGLTEVIFNREVPGHIDDPKRLTVARHERRIRVVSNPPQVLLPVHRDQAFQLSTHGHRSSCPPNDLSFSGEQPRERSDRGDRPAATTC